MVTKSKTKRIAGNALMLLVVGWILSLPGQARACTSFAVYASEPWYGMNFDYPETDLDFSIAQTGNGPVFEAFFSGGGHIAEMNDRGLFENLQDLYYNTPQTFTYHSNTVSIETLYDYPITDLATVSAVLNYIGGNQVVQSWGEDLHMLVADSTGNAMVVEPFGNYNGITPIQGQYIVMTNLPNFDFINQPYSAVYGTGADRYVTACSRICGHLSSFGMADAWDTLKQTIQTSGSYLTRLSMVFRPASRDVYLCFARDFSKVWKISIDNRTIETFSGFPLSNIQSLNTGGVWASQLTSPFAVSDETVPVLVVQPASQTVTAPGNISISVVATGIGLTYQWLANGIPITGNATGASSTLVLPQTTVADSGTYDCVIANAAGSVTSNAALVTVNPAVSNVPVFSTQPESQTIASGSTVVFTAAASGSPTYQWSASNDGGSTWSNLTDGNGISGSSGPQLVIQGAGVAGSGEYACVATNSGGSVRSRAANLTVADASNPGTLINISARAFVGSGGNVMIGGFTIGGSTSRTVLIQALGPALAGEGVSGVLLQPELTIHDSTGATIFSNTGWGSGQVLLNAAAAAYANPVLEADSGDSEVLLTLPPGGYTAEISGADGGTGIALCAIYQLP